MGKLIFIPKSDDDGVVEIYPLKSQSNDNKPFKFQIITDENPAIHENVRKVYRHILYKYAQVYLEQKSKKTTNFEQGISQHLNGAHFFWGHEITGAVIIEGAPNGDYVGLSFGTFSFRGKNKKTNPNEICRIVDGKQIPVCQIRWEDKSTQIIKKIETEKVPFINLLNTSKLKKITVWLFLLVLSFLVYWITKTLLSNLI